MQLGGCQTGRWDIERHSRLGARAVRFAAETVTITATPSAAGSVVFGTSVTQTEGGAAGSPEIGTPSPFHRPLLEQAQANTERTQEATRPGARWTHTTHYECGSEPGRITKTET